MFHRMVTITHEKLRKCDCLQQGLQAGKSLPVGLHGGRARGWGLLSLAQPDCEDAVLQRLEDLFLECPEFHFALSALGNCWIFCLVFKFLKKWLLFFLRSLGTGVYFERKSVNNVQVSSVGCRSSGVCSFVL